MATDQRTTGNASDGELPLALTVASAAVAAAVLLPVLWLVRTAFTVGLNEAIRLSVSSGQVFVNSVLLAAVVTGASILLGVPLAYLTVRTDLPFRRFWTVAVSLPLVIPSYVGAFAYVSAFGPRGEFQRLLAPLGVESLPQTYGLFGTTLVLTLYTYPYVFITTRAALKSLDTTLVDAARTLEHTRWEAFKRVTVPQIRPAVAAGSLLVALYALADFGTPAIMRYEVFTWVIFTEFNIGNQQMAVMLSLHLLAVSLLVLALESRARGDGPLYSGQQGGRSSGVVSLGTWRWAATVVPAAVAGFALLVPTAVLGLWLIRGTSDVGRSLAMQPSFVLNSVGVAAGAAVLAIVAGLPIAILAARHRGRLVTLFERASYVGYGVPGVVLGLALVFLGARVLTPVYQTVYLLVFAYLVRFLPQAVGSMRASFLRVNPALPEAARTLGRTSVGAFREVTMPLVAPGVVGGAALVFLTTMKELPVTLLLKPAGFTTLVTLIWSATEQGYYGYAAMPAIILLLVSGLSMLVILSQEGYDVK